MGEQELDWGFSPTKTWRISPTVGWEHSPSAARRGGEVWRGVWL